MCRFVATLTALAIVFGMATLPVSHAPAGPFRAGAAAENLTAEASEVPVDDLLFAKALVIDDGAAQVVLVCIDLGGASQTFVSSLRGRLADELEIEPSTVLVNASHNHHSQGQVADDVVDRTVRAVRRAREGMVPVRIGSGSGRENRIMMNRRLRLVDGTDWTIRRANPSPPDSQIEKLGPIDPEIGALRLDRLDGRPLAVLYNFAGHAYGGVPSGGVTADFPGFASTLIQESLGDGAVALFLQGAAGDITPIRYKDVDTPPPTEQLGTLLGLSTLRAVRRITPGKEGSVRVISETIELPRRQDVQARIASLESEQEEILQFFTGVGCGTHGAGTFLNFKGFLPLYLKHAVSPEHPSYATYLYAHEQSIGRNDLVTLDAENRRRIEKYLACLENMERLIRVRSNLQIFRRHEKRSLSEPISAEIQGVRIGDFALVTFPGELFAEVALRIKEESPLEHTFVAGYTNGHVGYAPTADLYEHEAYEDSLSPFAPEWQAIYETKALDLLNRLNEPNDR